MGCYNDCLCAHHSDFAIHFLKNNNLPMEQRNCPLCPMDRIRGVAQGGVPCGCQSVGAAGRVVSFLGTVSYAQSIYKLERGPTAAVGTGPITIAHRANIERHHTADALGAVTAPHHTTSPGVGQRSSRKRIHTSTATSPGVGQRSNRKRTHTTSDASTAI